jgi:hypothetical protein
MHSSSMNDQRRRLVTLITESLLLADQLGLPLVGIALDGALAQLGGVGSAVDAKGDIVD